MAKKLTAYDRRKLIEARERGLSDSEIKRQFGITDDRTLKRHLKLAEQEQEAKFVKTEILKKAIEDHLSELRQLIEGWKAGIGIHPVTASPSSMADSLESIHSIRLFGCLKSHLPFPTLWRDHSQWEAKYRSYIDNCNKLREEIQKEATTRMSLDFMDGSDTLSHLSPKLIYWILRRVEHKLQKGDEQGLEFRWKHVTGEVDRQPTRIKQMSVHPDSETLLKIFGQQEVDEKFYEKECRELLTSCLEGEPVANLLTLVDDLRDLKHKIHDALEEILLRRDYILYTCDLCPGGKPRLLR